jgi:hypothetical protein
MGTADENFKLFLKSTFPDITTVMPIIDIKQESM